VDRAAKRELVATLHDMLKDTGVIVVARNNGLVAAQSAEFRNRVNQEPDAREVQAMLADFYAPWRARAAA